MSESLRDQLLKSGLARKLKPEPKPAKPPQRSASPQRPAPPKRERSEIDLAKAYAIRDSAERAERERVQREAEQRSREKKERRQKLTALLNGKAQNVQDADIARHFPHAGRYLIVDVETAKAAREIDPESLVLLCDPMEKSGEDDVPSDLVW